MHTRKQEWNILTLEWHGVGASYRKKLQVKKDYITVTALRAEGNYIKSAIIEISQLT